jgi:hypothetical protein
MYGALRAQKLCERLHDVLLEGTNVGEIWPRLQGGGIFEETCRFVIVDDGVHSWRDIDGIAHARGGAIKRLNIRIVDTELSNVH